LKIRKTYIFIIIMFNALKSLQTFFVLSFARQKCPDIAWVLRPTSTLGRKFMEDFEDLEPKGSWTIFLKNVTSSDTNKCFLQYLQVVPLPPNDNVCKWYLDLVLQMTDDLELRCIFAHADEAINSKMVLIKWLYDKIITLIGVSHSAGQTEDTAQKVWGTRVQRLVGRCWCSSLWISWSSFRRKALL